VPRVRRHIGANPVEVAIAGHRASGGETADGRTAAVRRACGEDVVGDRVKLAIAACYRTDGIRSCVGGKNAKSRGCRRAEP
jgi:hypothetical protein